VEGLLLFGVSRDGWGHGVPGVRIPRDAVWPIAAWAERGTVWADQCGIWPTGCRLAERAWCERRWTVRAGGFLSSGSVYEAAKRGALRLRQSELERILAEPWTLGVM